MKIRSLFFLILPCLFFISCTKDCDTSTPTTPTTPTTLTEGLVLYMPFSGNLADSSGFSNNGAPFGAVAYSSNRYFEQEKSLVLNGTAFAYPVCC